MLSNSETVCGADEWMINDMWLLVMTSRVEVKAACCRFYYLIIIIKYCHNHYYANGAPNYLTQII